MLTTEQKQQLKAFTRNLKDSALSPDDDRYVAVFCDPNDAAKEDPISQIATNINFSESASVNLLTGPRGSGKSTELKRLGKLLEDDDCVVFHCDMSPYINLTTPVDVTDFLISLMAAFNDAVSARYGEDFTQRSFTERLKDFLTREISIDSGSFKTAVGSIKASLKDDPGFKQQLQQSLKGYVSQIVRQARDFAKEVSVFVRQQSGDPDKKVVLLADSIEQIRGVGSDAEAVYKSVENLFAAHADSLQFPLLHILYTVPPYMSALAPGFARVLGGNPIQTLPSIHVRDRRGNDDVKGLALMQEIVEKRCDSLYSILTEAQVKALARLSGGDLRNYFRFIRQCLVRAATASGFALPLQPPLFDQVVNQFRREIFIPEEDLQWLRKIDQSSNHQLSGKEALAQFAHFLDTALVLNYRNGEDWYGVNPLLKELLESD